MKRMFAVALGLMLVFVLFSVSWGAILTPIKTAVVSSFTNAQVTVNTTATLIKAANANRVSLVIRNIGATDIFIGTASVTTVNGFLIKVNESIALDRNTAALYGVVATSPTTVSYIEE